MGLEGGQGVFLHNAISLMMTHEVDHCPANRREACQDLADSQHHVR